jgi:hypothetical protein
VSPNLTVFRLGLHFGAELLPGLDLLASESGLFLGQEPRVGLAVDSTGEAEIGAVTRFGIMGTGAARFAAFDGALG